MEGPSERRQRFVWISIALVAAIAVIDFASGTAIRIYPLYFGPIALAAWYGPPRTGLLMPVFATAAWMASNRPPTLEGWPATVWVINTLTQGTAFFTVGYLIRQLRKRLEREQALGRRDPLTGLANSRAFHEYGAILLAGSARGDQPATLAYVDLDNFKQVNDTRGHLEGDRVLKTVAEVLMAGLRKSDIAARIGGDEFAILLPSTGSEGAVTLLERLRQAILEAMRAEGWPVTASIGAIAYAHAPPTLTEAIQRADGVMYKAKRGGKDRVFVARAEAATGTQQDRPRTASGDPEG